MSLHTKRPISSLLGQEDSPPLRYHARTTPGRQCESVISVGKHLLHSSSSDGEWREQWCDASSALEA